VGGTMSSDQEYLQSWRDLRGRERLFWFFVLNYVPGVLLIIAVINAFGHDSPEHIGACLTAVWLTGFGGAGLYRQNFCCPRCRQFFFRRFKLLEPYARNCVNCNLACGALDP
jgi:hypothetical protein